LPTARMVLMDEEMAGAAQHTTPSEKTAPRASKRCFMGGMVVMVHGLGNHFG
jgi:hypothetical protein